MLKINKNQIIFFIIILILIGGAMYYFYINSSENADFLYLENDIIQESDKKTNEVEMEETKVEEEIVVHITGQVINSGIVKLKENSRIIDAIEAAGGATKEADLTKINLAFILSDGQKIYIPSVEDEEIKEYVTENSGENVREESDSLEQSININTATSQQLQKLPGIGETIANRIIAYRNSKGKFEKIEDLKNVSGIGEAKFNNIKDYINTK